MKRIAGNSRRVDRHFSLGRRSLHDERRRTRAGLGLPNPERSGTRRPAVASAQAAPSPKTSLPEAVNLLEQAVTIAPRDAGYRLLLADAYMKSGRFQSAEATYRDVLDDRSGPQPAPRSRWR